MLDICLFAGNRRMKIAQLLLKQGLITIQPTIHLRNEMKLKWELHSTLQMGLDLHNPILLLPYQMFQLVILIFRQNIFSHLHIYVHTMWEITAKRDHDYTEKSTFFPVKSSFSLKNLLKSWFHGNFWTWSRRTRLKWFHVKSVKKKKLALRS